jgi:hypothetical protein
MTAANGQQQFTRPARAVRRQCSVQSEFEVVVRQSSTGEGGGEEEEYLLLEGVTKQHLVKPEKT